MGDPRHEPEVIRAKIHELVAEFRGFLRELGYCSEELESLVLLAERDAFRFVQLVADEWDNHQQNHR